MKPTIHSTGSTKVPAIIPAKPVKKPARALPNKPSQAVRKEPAGEFIFESSVNPRDQKVTMAFLDSALAQYQETGTITATPRDIQAAMKLLLALLEDADTLASIVESHNDMLAEAALAVEGLLESPASKAARRNALRWYQTFQEGDGPSPAPSE